MRVAIRGHSDRFGVYYADTAVAVALLALTWVSVATKAPETGQRGGDALAYVLVFVLTAPLVVHRRYPLGALGATAAAFMVMAALQYAVYPGIPLFVLLGAIALHADRRRALIALVVSLISMLVGLSLQPSQIATPADWTSSLLAVAVAWLVGENVRNRRARWTAMEERAARLEHERLDRDRRAAVAERLRIARELHDVVAHSMSVIAIQSGVGHHLIDSNPAEARWAIGIVESTSRSAMHEMRRLLGVLREDETVSGGTTPAPGLADLPALFARVRETGLAIDYKEEGSMSALPAAMDLSAYRIVQEALTNVIKHGGPVAAVTARRDDRAVVIDVRDDGAPGRPDPAARLSGSGDAEHTGHGLIGMRERVAVFGGELSAGPRPGGGFAVTARLPLNDPVPAVGDVDGGGVRT
jgi:signal transduction histidine kinase